MPDAPVSLHSLTELRDYVSRVLCEREQLVADQFVLEESVLSRRGQACGRQFLLRGPRSVRLGAVWASDRNDLYFYDARGERFRKERLAGAIVALNDAA